VVTPLLFSGARRGIAAAVAGMLAVLLLPACSGQDDQLRRRFEAAWAACLGGECAAQEKIAREWLCRHPSSVAGHYLLGKSYLHRPDANTTIAKGEFETALMLLDEGIQPDLPENAPLSEDIRAVLHRDTSLALMRALYDGAALVPDAVALPVAELALRHVRAGLKYNPQSAYLREMETALMDILMPSGRVGV